MNLPLSIFLIPSEHYFNNQLVFGYQFQFNIIMFCCIKKSPDDNLEQQQAIHANDVERKKTITSVWEIPVPENKNIESIKKIVDKQPINQSEVAYLQNNSQIMLFNIQEGKEVVISFNIKKQIMNIPTRKRSAQNLNIYNQQNLYSILAKRGINQLKLIIVQHKNELIQKKYFQYNNPFNIFMILPQETQYIRKVSLKEKKAEKFQSSEELDSGKKIEVKVAQPLPENQNNHEQQKCYVESFPFSSTQQLRLSQFDEIVVIPPFQHNKSGETLTTAAKLWLENVIESFFQFIDKQSIILPEGTKLNEVLEIIEDVIHQKLKDKTLENICNTINFELQGIYRDFELKYIILKKRKIDKEKQSDKENLKMMEEKIEKQNELILMILAKNLFMIEFGEKSSNFYSLIMEKIKKLKFIEYIKMKSLLKQNNSSKKSIDKLLRQLKWCSEQFLQEFNKNFGTMKKIMDSSGQSMIFKFHLLKQMKLSINEFLKFKKSNIQENYYQQEDNNQFDNIQSRASSKIEAIVPSYQQYLEKQERIQSLVISSKPNSIKYEIKISQDSEDNSKRYHLKSSFSNQNDYYNLLKKQNSKNRKNSNDF